MWVKNPSEGVNPTLLRKFSSTPTEIPDSFVVDFRPYKKTSKTEYVFYKRKAVLLKSYAAACSQQSHSLIY